MHVKRHPSTALCNGITCTKPDSMHSTRASVEGKVANMAQFHNNNQYAACVRQQQLQRRSRRATRSIAAYVSMCTADQ